MLGYFEKTKRKIWKSFTEGKEEKENK